MTNSALVCNFYSKNISWQDQSRLGRRQCLQEVRRPRIRGREDGLKRRSLPRQLLQLQDLSKDT